MKKYNKLYTGGTFDLYHAGHANFLRQCRALAETVIVALNSDKFIREFKCEPILDIEQRVMIMRSCKYVDIVIEHTNGFNSKKTIEPFNVDCIAIGSDWKDKDYFSQMGFDQSWLDQKRIDLVYIPYGNYMNTTAIKRKVITFNNI